MSRSSIILHVIIFLVLSIIVAIVIHEDVTATAGNYISGIGSVASVYAIFITLYQLGNVKNVAVATREAVLSKTKEIETLFSYADIERHLEMCSYIAMCLQYQQNEAAALRMADITKIVQFKGTGLYFTFYLE